VNTEQNYYVLRVALNRFGKVPHELAAIQLEQVFFQASRECELEQLVLNSVEAQDVHIPESALCDAVKQIKNNYPNRESYISDLKHNGLSEPVYEQAVGRELKVKLILDGVALHAAAISELDCRLFYTSHREKFRRSEARTVRHILITLNEDYAENSRQAALDKMIAIRERVKEKPRCFAEQAMKYSECPTALYGGLLGKLSKGKLYPELEAKLFSMHAGEISGVVETELGFHLLYCEQIHLAGTVLFEEAKRQIREQLAKHRKRVWQKSWLWGLKEKAGQAVTR